MNVEILMDIILPGIIFVALVCLFFYLTCLLIDSWSNKKTPLEILWEEESLQAEKEREELWEEEERQKKIQHDKEQKIEDESIIRLRKEWPINSNAIFLGKKVYVTGYKCEFFNNTEGRRYRNESVGISWIDNNGLNGKYIGENLLERV